MDASLAVGDMVAKDDEQRHLRELLDLGYSGSRARRALRLCNGDSNRALVHLASSLIDVDAAAFHLGLDPDAKALQFHENFVSTYEESRAEAKKEIQSMAASADDISAILDRIEKRMHSQAFGCNEEIGLDDEYDQMESELLARMTEDERREYVALNND